MKGSAGLRQLKKTVKEAAFEAVLDASTDIQSSGRDVVRSWRNKVDFGEKIYNGLNRLEVVIKPKGNRKAIRIFQYVDKGTKGPYLIPKVVLPGKMLKFQTGYSARTMPVARYNMGTGKSFGPWVSKAQVIHPGIEARDFLEWFMEDLAPTLQRRVQDRITLMIT